MIEAGKNTAETFWRVAAIAAAVAVVLMSGINGVLLDTGLGNALEFLIGVVFGLVAVSVCALVLKGVSRLIAAMPAFAVALIGGALFALWYLSNNSVAQLMRTLLDTAEWSWPFALADALSVLPLASIVIAVALVSGLVASTMGDSLRHLARPHRIILLANTIGFAGIAIAVVIMLAHDGADPFADDGVSLSAFSGAVELADPTARGNYSFEYLTYGAGENARRPEFGAERDLEARTVDISGLLPEWKDFKQEMRERYWGISLKEAPLNGQVWAPEGNGPFPLVLIVHGNHGMEDYSDSGYAYLGELLASRGF
ncbi:MAG: hypothetical protein GTO41_17160, partial [Burkholderiales bacterium]|nr:hypothetical protein [Burkholderiales bacterium]